MDGVGRVAGKLPRPRPAAPLGCTAEAALVIGVGGNSRCRPGGAGTGEGVRVIVEAVQPQDHRARLDGREPTAERQLDAIGGNEGVGRQRRTRGGECCGKARWRGGTVWRGGGATAGKKRGEAENDKTHGGSKEAPSLPRLWLTHGKGLPAPSSGIEGSLD